MHYKNTENRCAMLGALVTQRCLPLPPLPPRAVAWQDSAPPHVPTAFSPVCSCRGCIMPRVPQRCSPFGHRLQQRQLPQRCRASYRLFQASAQLRQQHKPMWTLSCGACRPTQGQNLQSLRTSMRSSSSRDWARRRQERLRCLLRLRSRGAPLPHPFCRQASARLGPMHATSCWTCPRLFLPVLFRLIDA